MEEDMDDGDSNLDRDVELGMMLKIRKIFVMFVLSYCYNI